MRGKIAGSILAVLAVLAAFILYWFLATSSSHDAAAEIPWRWIGLAIGAILVTLLVVWLFKRSLPAVATVVAARPSNNFWIVLAVIVALVLLFLYRENAATLLTDAQGLGRTLSTALVVSLLAVALTALLFGLRGALVAVLVGAMVFLIWGNPLDWNWAPLSPVAAKCSGLKTAHHFGTTPAKINEAGQCAADFWIPDGHCIYQRAAGSSRVYGPFGPCSRSVRGTVGPNDVEYVWSADTEFDGHYALPRPRVQSARN